MFVVCLLGFGLLFGAIELIQRKLRISKEVSRKLAHVGAAGGAAILPWLLSWSSVFWLAICFIGIMLVSRYLHIFQSIHEVSRDTNGEIYMPLAIALLALFVRQPQIYVTALIVLALADTAANIIGRRFGHKTLPWGGKTWLGCFAFFVSGLIIMEFSALFATTWAQGALILTMAGSTVAEAIGLRGSDNLLVPIACAGLLKLLTS
jgi:phytol kinase